MHRKKLLQLIIAKLNHDLEVLSGAARIAHEAATHEENIPDNRYDTLALEASYLAQGQANRASEVRQAINVYRQLGLLPMNEEEICLTSLVTLEAADGNIKTVFIGPLEGGMKIIYNRSEVLVITPGSPLGNELLGKAAGDTIEVGTGSSLISYEITGVR